MDRALIVTITAGSRPEAETIATALVEQRLAGCVKVLPVGSVYRWNEAIERADEVLLIAKTREALFPAIEKTVLGLHSYEVPEILAVPVSHGHGPYLDWLLAATSQR